MNQKATVSKELNAKHKKLLEALYKLPENRECADCKCRGPRWASVNLGIFICMQCSGIHRSLGVHISKVRSVTLDTWLPDQVSFIQSMGNEKSNGYWEAELPPRYDRVGIENFIRAKYVDKRWIPRDGRERPSSTVNNYGLMTHSKNAYLNGIKQSVEVRKIPPPPSTVRSTRIAKSNGHPLPETTRQIIRDPKPLEVHQKVETSPLNEVSETTEYAVSKKEAETAIVAKPESEIKVSETKPGVEASAPKVDYVNDLFNLLYMDPGEINSKPFCIRIQASERTSTLEESAHPISVERKKKMNPGIGDLFQELEWVTPQPASNPPENKINGITNTFEKSSMASTFPVQNQPPILSEQPPFLSDAKPIGAPQAMYGTINRQSSNHLHAISKNRGSNRNYGSGMMIPLAELQKHPQMRHIQPSYHAADVPRYTTSSIQTRGPSTIYPAPSSIPAHLGGFPEDTNVFGFGAVLMEVLHKCTVDGLEDINIKKTRVLHYYADEMYRALEKAKFIVKKGMLDDKSLIQDVAFDHHDEARLTLLPLECVCWRDKRPSMTKIVGEMKKLTILVLGPS